MIIDSEQQTGQQNSGEGQRVRNLCSSLSHDLNNYVGAIQGYVELLKLDLEDQEELSGYLDSVLDSCKKITARTTMMENFAQHQNVAATSCDLNEILADIIPKFSGLSYVALDEPAHALVDPHLLERSIQQLYLNSLEASCPNPRLSLRRDGPWLEARFEDEGSGIREGWGEQIFDPYVTTKGKGKGFGLSWAQVGWDE